MCSKQSLKSYSLYKTRKPASNLSYLGERSKPRENGRASGETVPPLACLARVYFSRYPPNGQLTRRLRTRLGLKQGTMYIHADVKLVRTSKEVKPYPPPKRQPLLELFRSHPLIPLKVLAVGKPILAGVFTHSSQALIVQMFWIAHPRDGSLSSE